jgi:hypothetical protein
VTALLATINASVVPIRISHEKQWIAEIPDGRVSGFPDPLAEKTRGRIRPPFRSARSARRAFGAVR